MHHTLETSFVFFFEEGFTPICIVLGWEERFNLTYRMRGCGVLRGGEVGCGVGQGRKYI